MEHALSTPMMDVPAPLRELEAHFVEASHSLLLVGGCVRDAIMGVACADVDMATSATPEQQIALYEAKGYRWIGTGLAHGTITVIAGGVPYEITTLRRDVETDGRHAVVAWTPDVVEDLGRRDMTINAIAMTFDGEIVDPFGGVADCASRTIRFVGDATTRILEDNLRILRWFRFLSRFGLPLSFERSDLDAIRENAHLLRSVSVERIRSEMRGIVTGPAAAVVVQAMDAAGVLKAIGLGTGDLRLLHKAAMTCDDPTVVIAAWQGESAPAIVESWKSSRADIELTKFVSARVRRPYAMGNAMVDLLDGAEREVVTAILRIQDQKRALAVIDRWTVPVFPLKGQDLLDAGMTAGPEMGRRLTFLKTMWINSGFAADAPTLLAIEFDGNTDTDGNRP